MTVSIRTVGILGLGSIGRRHGGNVAALGYSVIGFDPSEESRQRFAQEVDGLTVTRDALFNDADAIIVASPSGRHLDDLETAINLGKPTLVEKPLGHNPERTEDLVQRAERSGVLVAAAHNLRFRRSVLVLRNWLKEGIIGKSLWARFLCGSYLPDWRPGSDYRANYAADSRTGGVIFDSIHEIDLAQYLFGAATVQTSLAVHTGMLEIESEDLAEIVLGHGARCISSIHLDYVMRPRRRSVMIAGTDGVLMADLRSGQLTAFDLEDRVAREENTGFHLNEEYVALVQNFIAAVEHRAKLICSAREGLAAVKLACAARRKAGLPESTQVAVAI